jgi:ATP-dependent RNA helicase DeaD
LTPKSVAEDSPPQSWGEAESANEPGSAGEVEQGDERRPPKRIKGGPRLETFRIEVGHAQGVQPGNIVGAIANEAALDGRNIGHIDIRDDHSFVDLPVGMPNEIFKTLQAVKVRGVELRISRVASKPAGSTRPPRSDRPSRAPERNNSAPRHGQSHKGPARPARR